MRLERAVLLGAGWSIPFGGYTTRDLTDRVRGEVWKHPDLRDRFDTTESSRKGVRCFTYEEILSHVQDQRDLDHERILLSAIGTVMSRMDADMRAYRNLPWELAGMSGYHAFLSGLSPFGVVFTLNHDLWFERFVSNAVVKLNILGQPAPGEKVKPELHWDATNHWEPEEFHPSAKHCRIDKGALNIVKLHGSLNWKDKSNRILVMGANKHAAIKASPVLKRMDTLKDKLLVKARRIMIYGYSFGDEHINEALSSAADQGAEFYVFDKSDYSVAIGKIRSAKLSGRFTSQLRHYSSLGELVFRKPPRKPSSSAASNAWALDDRLVEFLPSDFRVGFVAPLPQWMKTR